MIQRGLVAAFAGVTLACAGLGCSSERSSGSMPAPSATAPPAPAVGSGHGQCALRVGTFTIESTVRDGTCGPLPERLTHFDQTARPIDAGADAGPDPCAVDMGSTSSDNCEVDYQTQCPNDGAEKGGMLSVIGSVKWDVAGDFGTGIEQWAAVGAAGNALCIGTYNIVLRKQ